MLLNLLLVTAPLLILNVTAFAGDGGLEPFEGQCDIGPAPAGSGSATFEPGTKTFSVTGGGKNVWFAADAFHFVWKKVPAGTNLSLAATVQFDPPHANSDPHRKAFVMIRQSLDPDSPYADACLHGNGLTAIQYRLAAKELTFETQGQSNAPKRIRIEKRGDVFSASSGSSDADLQPIGGACKLTLSGDFYVGIGVCAHNEQLLESARFSDIVIASVAPIVTGQTRMLSTLETIDPGSRDRRAVCTISLDGLARAEAPNWSSDNLLYFNQHGKLYKIPADAPSNSPPAKPLPAPAQIELGTLNINNDHVLSPDGKEVAVSGESQEVHQSAIWIAPLQGPSAQPHRITPNTPSYLHGWSPDGSLLAFCGLRAKNFDIYTIPVTGGEEKRLTDSAGKDDGPEFSPDGTWIYFNSERTGSMQIWRMKIDGSGQEQITRDERNNWFPHLSPDGQHMAYIAYESGITDHPENKDVELRLMNLSTGKITTLARLFGGQGTMNVNSWSPDSKHLAFVSYQIVPR